MMNNNHITIIESDDYRDEEESLKRDPIVIAMAKECDDVPEAGLEGYQFTMAALREYRRRGGTQAHSIGSVARAIRALLKRERNA